MKKYITAFFTFIGYVTFLFAMGAGIMLYIGYRKSQAAEAAVMTNQHGQVISLQPAKQADTLTTATQTLPDFQPISRKPAVSATKTKTVRHHAPRKPPTSVSAKPVAHTTTMSVEASAKMSAKPTWVKAKPKVEKAKPRRNISSPAKTKKATQEKQELPPITLAFQATDSANPRTGKGKSHVPNVYETTELERQAKRNVDLQQLKEAAEQLRNPPVSESIIFKFLRGN